MLYDKNCFLLNCAKKKEMKKVGNKKWKKAKKSEKEKNEAKWKQVKRKIHYRFK